MCWLRCVHIARTSGQRWVQWDLLAFGDLWCGRRRRGRCGRDGPRPYFVTILSLLPFPSLHAIPFTLPLPLPSPEGAGVQEDSDEARHLCPAGGGVWDEGGSSEVYPVLVTFSTAAQDHVNRLRGVETTPRGMCLGGGWEGGIIVSVSIHTKLCACLVWHIAATSICFTRAAVLLFLAPIGNDCVCNVPLQLLSNRNETILILASAAVGNFLLPVSASRQVCVCVCVHAWASGKHSVRHFIFISSVKVYKSNLLAQLSVSLL